MAPVCCANARAPLFVDQAAALTVWSRKLLKSLEAMSAKPNQVAEPVEAPEQSGDDLNSVSRAPGADRLEFIRGLIETAPSEPERQTDPEPEETSEEDEEDEDEDDAEKEVNEPGPNGSETETTPDEPPAEQNEQEEAQAEDEVGIPGLSPELQRKIEKRIGKEVAKRKALQQQLDEALTKANAVREPEQPAQQVRPADDSDPLSHVQTREQLAKELKEADAAIDYADSTLDRLELRPDEVVQELRAAGVTLDEDHAETAARAFLKGVKRKAERVIRSEKNAAGRIEMRQAFATQVREQFDFVKDQSSEGFQTMQNILQRYPWLRNEPNGELLAAIAVEGLQSWRSRLSKPKATLKPTAKPAKVPAQPSVPSAAPSRKSGADADSQEARQAWSQNPRDPEARRRMIALQLRG